MPRPVVPRRRQGAVRRQEILDAALRCFDARGLYAVGIEEIRREAGASPSSVYHLFADREDIVLALLIDVFRDLFAHLARRVTVEATAEGVVRALVDGHIEWIAANPVRGRFMYQAMTVGLHDPAPLVAAKVEGLMPVLAHLGPFIARGELPAWSPDWFDVAVLGVAHEALRRWLGGAEGFAPEVLRRTLPDLAWRSLGR